MKNILTGTSFIVPVTNVSLIDLSVRLTKNTSLDEITKLVKDKSEMELKV